ncbi:MAG: bifunctional demethylmenaquinone methyltransferase/2-methoxy-6-polyprenyl-1,4-benzoquinol methylase UbiE [Alphaproteobacteria bacterium]|nr:bifunctional demethylmenaquinone methyltransferase/2-methoxy-6-polyprenyl-1,4-benzoquinol methylase UbiE [Alphaproteobacteria bacterium]
MHYWVQQNELGIRDFFVTNQKFTDFGFSKIPLADKSQKVKDLFADVASDYDLMNDLMSMGTHRLWKKNFISQLPVRSGDSILDVAGGTGDIAIGLQQRYPHLNLSVCVCDLTHPMLTVGRDRAINNGLLRNLTWCCGDAENLPIPDQSVDLYTIAFGLRNVTNKESALAEAVRVLKPGGQFFCLEFSHVTAPLPAKLYDWYSFSALPFLGHHIAQNKDAYQYLAESIRTFPDQETLVKMMKAAGFNGVKYENWLNGVVSVHSGAV